MPSAAANEARTEDGRWLLLTHHLPPDPPYLRVKVRRRLERIGAVPLKNSVYVLPDTPDALEDFQWLFQEIEREGGEATLSEASFVDGVTAARLVERFRDAREGDYAEVTASARALLEEIGRDEAGKRGAAGIGARLERLTKRLREVSEVDFFEAPGRAAAEHAVGRARGEHWGDTEGTVARTDPVLNVRPGRAWITREGVKIDRIGSAWLIRRFIDPEARFVFAPARGYEPAEGELRFDMFEGEFTHEGDACTFETLLARFGLDDPALVTLGELVHDIDCKDDKFGRPEAAGLASMIDGLVRRHADDEARFAQGGELFDGLYEHFAHPTG
jgi:hypothetical protein